MSDKDRSSERNKVFFLILGTAFLLLAILNALVFSPAGNAAKESKVLIEELDGKILRGGEWAYRSEELIVKNKATSTEILRVLREDLPPESGRYSWALSTLSEIALDVDLEIAVQNHPHLRYIPVKTRERLDVNSVPLWVTYAVDVELNVSFLELVQFMGALHDAQPYCSVAALEINALRSTPEKHSIVMTLEWPVLRFEKDFERLQALSIM